ncbi:MAG: outer membrane lipoprotein-sorting protein [Parvibaculum sp.]
MAGSLEISTSTSQAFALLVAVLLSAAPAAADVTLPPESDAAARGLAIVEEMDARDRGWGDAKATLRMVLTNAAGDTSERELRLLMLEVTEKNEGDWSLMVFDKPRDIEGTALLTHAHVTEPDDQWLYLPAVKRVKRISSANKSGPFVGSEFAFEDLAAQETGKFTYKWLREEPCGTLTCHVVERVPSYEGSGYTRQVVWIDTTDYLMRKTDYYDRKDSLLKTLGFGEYKTYLDGIWRPLDLEMTNHETGKTTKLVWESYEFKTGLTENDFSTASLERAR